MSANLRRVVKEIEFQGEEFIVTFDMRSVATYKEISNKGYVQSIPELGKMEDEAVINFLGATMRRKETPKQPIGAEIYNMDLASLLLSHNGVVVDVVMGATPQGNTSKPGKK